MKPPVEESIGFPIRRRRYDEVFKRNAVRDLMDSGKPVVAMAELLGVEQSLLHRWKKRYGWEFVRSCEEVSSGKRREEVSQQELELIKREIVVLRESLEVLKSVIRKALLDKSEILPPHSETVARTALI